MEKKFDISNKDLIDKLIKLQNEILNLEKENNLALFRIIELDIYNLLEKLNLKPCEICKYHLLNKDKKCELEVRCKSYIFLKKISENDNYITVKLKFNFKLL